MRRRPAAAQRSGRDQPPLRRGSGAFAALPPRHDKPFEHRRRLPFRRRDAAYRRRAGGQNPRARRYDPHRMPGKRAPYRRQAHHGRGTRRRQDTAGEERHFGHPSRGDVRPDRADAGSAPGIPRPDGRHAGTYGLFSVYLLLRPQSFPYINRNLYYYAEGGDVWDTLFDTEAMRPKMVLFSAQPPCADPAWSEVVTLMAPIATDIWSAWSGSAPGRRPEAYTALKTAVAEPSDGLRLRAAAGLRAAIEQTVRGHAPHLPALHRNPPRGCLRPAERLPQRHGDLHSRTDEIRKPAAHGAEPDGSRRDRGNALGGGDLRRAAGHGISG